MSAIATVLYDDTEGNRRCADWTDDGWRESTWDGQRWTPSTEPTHETLLGLARTLRLREFGATLTLEEIVQVPAHILTRARDLYDRRHHDQTQGCIALAISMAKTRH